jgi:hypothetical protein
MSSNPQDDHLDASDVWLTPSSGRVVFDERGNSSWQWPTSDDPFTQTGVHEMTAADLRIAEPVEIRRSRLPWVHESERTGPQRALRPRVMATGNGPARNVR